ncbi:MAG TPA: hypothetical protein VJM31_12535 [Vicinamibacterales bacterium]|nr:hypothetical protein [Vicinamibacterales bacterium]
MDFDSPWQIVWSFNGATGRATHSSGLQLSLTRSGWATVTERPPSVSEVEATVLMAELQRMMTETERH